MNILLSIKLLELKRNRQKSSPECPRGHDGHGGVRGSDAVNFLSVALLVESHNPQDGRQDHSRAMDPSHGFMKADWTAGFGSGDSGRADRIVGGNEIQISRHPSESRMQIARGCARIFA